MNFKILILTVFVSLSAGCFKDLDTVPLDPDVVTAAVVFENPAAYKQFLAKIYAGFAVSGQKGPDGKADISGIDEGFGQYLRGFWYHQELPTDEALIGWNDQTIKDFHNQSWSSADGFVYAFYSRVFYQIAVANEFLRETTDAKLSDRGVEPALKSEIQAYRAEVRFLRAVSLWHALDMFRNIPFATDAEPAGIPLQKNPKEVFAFIESELKAIDGDLKAPRTNEYARADQAAAWMLLAKLYLNAEVYIQENKYEDCLTYCDKVIGAGYEMEQTYKNLFLADNHHSKEIIFPITFDGISTRTWGGMTFIIRAGIGGTMDPTASGVVSGWAGCRTTRQMIEKFPSDLTGIKVDFNVGGTVGYPKLYVPGSHQGFDATQTSNSLASPVQNSKIYEGYKYFPNANTEIQFTQISANSAPKFGDNGADGTLETGGAKIVVPEAGLHFLKVNLQNKTYIIEKRNFEIIGSATGGTPMAMTYDTASQTVQVAGNLQAGTFRFRANQDDTKNYGDTGADAILETDGDAIVIGATGGYKISLEIDKPDYTYRVQLTSFDRRGIFHTDGQNIDIADLSLFTDGYAVAKFKNVTSDGVGGKDTDFPDTDFPMFRLADAYLMAAEAVLRGAGGGDKTKALGYFNKVRERAFGGGQTGNFTASQLTLESLLDERARELYWEGHRRTDLVRFGQFTDGAYKWAWKGGVMDGASVPNHRNIYPIPSTDLNANPNLVQNPGY